MNNKLLFENWRKFLKEQDPAKPESNAPAKPVAGDAPPEKQAYIFDFDDTLGVTPDANGIMLYKDGAPAWKTAEEAQAWMKEKGFDQSDLLKGPKGASIEKPDGVDGFAIYVSSGGLAKARSGIPKDNIIVPPFKPVPGKTDKGEILVTDYSPSTTMKNAKPVDSTIEKLKAAKGKGSETEILTARSGESSVAAAKAAGKDRTPRDFAGKEHPPSVEADLKKFMQDKGALPKVVKGLGGGNKGDSIKADFFDNRPPEKQPEEIHFFDDDGINIENVKNALVGKVPAEVFLYGPGDFYHKKADANVPKVSAPKGKSVKESRGQTMKITKNYLKQIIKEELEEASRASGPQAEIVGVQRGVSERVVMLDVGGKQVKISFSASGGSPLVNDVFYEELSDDEREAAMAAAQSAAGMRMASDYSEQDMQDMMAGRRVSPFKP